MVIGGKEECRLELERLDQGRAVCTIFTGDDEKGGYNLFWRISQRKGN
jgi:hypothetical protein